MELLLCTWEIGRVLSFWLEVLLMVLELAWLDQLALWHFAGDVL